MVIYFVCILSSVFKNGKVYFDSDILAFLFCVFLVHFLFSLASKEIFNAICLVGDLLELKCRKIWKACQNWKVFQYFCKKCLWKYFCCLSFLSEDVAGNYHWKHSPCNCLEHVKSSISQRGNFKVLVIYTFISFSIQVQLDATSKKKSATWKML